ncbi:MAG: hypothetical protein RMI83_06345 [Desulfurococcaceae archaeon]|nr:hypothetical protein [Sulfolobales archaeon]MDW8170698.1 hypothetical protein [Desulfurococcaceae archaeon]
MSSFQWSLSKLATLAAASILIAVLMNAPSINACFDPSDAYSMEVLLNKPGVFLNSTLIEGASGVFKIDEYYVYKGVSNIVVIIYLEKVFNGAPLVPGINEGEPVELYPGIRLELMDVGLEADRVQVNESMVKYYTDLLKSTLLIELNRLKDAGVLVGLSNDDLRGIVESACIGCAGWNGRLIYYINDGAWHQYSELITSGAIRGTLIRSLGCRFELPEELKEALAMQQPSWPWAQASPINTPSWELNGVAVAISIAMGAAAAIAFYTLYMKMK